MLAFERPRQSRCNSVTMSQIEDHTPTSAPETSSTPKKRAAKHPYRVYGYRVTHDWVVKFGKDHGIGTPDMSDNSLESAVILHLMGRLPGLQRHFLDDPSDTDYGWCHCLTIANNWNAKKRSLAPGRLPTWKSVLGTEEEPRWYIPQTVPRFN